MANRRRTWPYSGEELNRDPPVGFFQAPDCVMSSARSLAGPLRTGTELRVGPRAAGARDGDRSERSDMGMDRVTPRDFDVMGTARQRFGDIPSSLVTSQLRRRGDLRNS